MTTRIIDNKRVDMTDDEYRLYEQICKAYEEFGGATLFSDLFEVNDAGIIQFLRPPSKKHTSMEVFLFIESLMIQQHIRVMYSEFKEFKQEMINNSINVLKEEITKLRKEFKSK